jgi:hypothetical protein
MNNQIVGNLNNMELQAFMQLDGSIEGINGDASVYLASDPNIVIDFNTCTVPHFRINDWNEGFGIDNNTGKHQHGLLSTTGAFAGGYHGNLRRAGCSRDRALNGIPNLKPFNEVKDIAHFQLSGSTHYENDYLCCEKCQSNADCDAWHTSKGYIDFGRQCTLSSVWISDDGYHSNWKAAGVSRGSFRGLGHTHSVILVSGDSQEERDVSCAGMCTADEKCELWMQSTKDRKCSLRGVLRNTGWLGIGRFLVNWIIDDMLRKMLNKVVKHMCNLGGVQTISKIAEAAEGWSIEGNASINLGVPAGFWNSSASNFWSNASSYDSLVLTSEVQGLESIQANHPAVQNVVRTFLSGLAQDFSAGQVAEELGAPVAFAVGSIIKDCIETGCPKKGEAIIVI